MDGLAELKQLGLDIASAQAEQAGLLDELAYTADSTARAEIKARLAELGEAIEVIEARAKIIRRDLAAAERQALEDEYQAAMDQINNLKAGIEKRDRKIFDRTEALFLELEMSLSDWGKVGELLSQANHLAQQLGIDKPAPEPIKILGIQSLASDIDGAAREIVTAYGVHYNQIANRRASGQPCKLAKPTLELLQTKGYFEFDEAGNPR
jgi:hypothetical protein